MVTETEKIVGIDFGTTNSVVATPEADGKSRILPNEEGEPLTPTVVGLGDEDNPVVGRAAVFRWALEPSTTIGLFKRSMGCQDSQGNPIPVITHPISGKDYPPELLAAIVIKKLIKDAAAALGCPISAVVITVPAYFDSAAREAIRRAAQLAGIKLIGMVNEPTAAAIAYGLVKKEEGTFLITDFGGGTYDVTVLRIKGDQYEVLATDGDCNTGGSNVNDLIAQCFIKAFQQTHAIEITPEMDPILWRELLDKCEMAKKALSQSTLASFIIAFQGKRLQFDITRDEFETLISPIIEKTKTLTEQALAAAKLQPSDITAVILVGGSSRIRSFQAMLKKVAGKTPRKDINPDEAVALGAALYAAQLAHAEGMALVDTKGQRFLPEVFELQEVTSHSLGCFAEKNGVEIMCVIIPANAKIPAEHEESFGMVHPNQTAVRVTIASGQDEALPDACKIYGVLQLKGLPPGPLTPDRIKVKYRFNADGTLHVTITDTISGKSTSDIQRGFEGLIGPGSAS